MDVFLSYKNVKEGQLVINQGDLGLIRYITVDPLLQEKFPDKDYALVRMTLINNKGIPFADTTVAYSDIEYIKDKVISVVR